MTFAARDVEARGAGASRGNGAWSDGTVLREGGGTCPVCVKPVPGRYIVDEGKVFLEKTCPEHGAHRAFLSAHPDYFGELMGFYDDLMPEELPQRDFILRLTGRCNLKCPICLASADEYKEEDLPLDQLVRFFGDRRRRTKLDLMGAEPTIRKDLEQIVRLAHEKGHITALHSNGIELSEPGLLERLIGAGLDEVHLQFDGFEDEHDEVLRGRSMREVRAKVLERLDKFGLATDLVVTVMRGLNEAQMGRVLDYAARHPFVKEVFYLGMRRLGRATERFATRAIAPDELIDDLERESGGRIRRDDIKVFQKLYFALLAAFKVRKCFYIHHYLVLRDPDGAGYRPIADFLDLPYLDRHLERFRELLKGGSRALATSYLFLHTSIAILRKRGLPIIIDGFVLNFILLLGFNLSKVKRRTILLGFITACDPWIHEDRVSANCGKGEISMDQGVHASGAEANVARERFHRRVDRERSG
jgi:pyruvate-formate lyase-activating enzyme